jgi:hypothetical protein
MKALMIAAALVTAVATGVPAAHAADLDDGYSDRHASPYDDPRYRDLYGSPSRYTERYEYQEPLRRSTATTTICPGHDAMLKISASARRACLAMKSAGVCRMTAGAIFTNWN